MSRATARAVLEQFNLRPAMVEQRYASIGSPGTSETVSSGFLADVREISVANMTAETDLARRRQSEIAAAYGVYGYIATDEKPFVFVDGLAIIPIHGVLINRFAYSWSFVTGYNFIRNQITAALADEDVVGIIYDVNSPGGMVAGCKETADVIRAASKAGGGKPSLAVVDANCYSAAYWLASAADKISVTPTGGAGSIGVLIMHLDMSAALEKFGFKVTFIFAGDHKVDGNSYEALPEDVKKDLQGEVDKLYGVFVGAVATNRGLAEKAVRDTEARCYLADDALALGLVDSVETPPEAMNSFFNADEEEDGDDANHLPEDEDPEDGNEDGDDNDDDDRRRNRKQEKNMADANKKDEKIDTVALAADARKAERDRVNGILNHPEAEGRGDLARHLATETDTSVEAAAGILKASPKQTAPKKDGAEGQGGDKNHFQTAMDKGKGPDVGAEGGKGDGNGGGDQPKSRSAEILDNHRRMTGGTGKTAA